MKCPACTVNIHENWANENFVRHGHPIYDQLLNAAYWIYRSMDCPECKRSLIQMNQRQIQNGGLRIVGDWRWVIPTHGQRPPASKEVPEQIAQDYSEACNVLSLSAKASAALSRRCLQAMLQSQGYKAGSLAKQIDMILSETDASKALPRKLRETIDVIRNFGNFSAHPVDDKNTFMIIDVDPLEAEWCLEISMEMFEHFYVGPAEAAAKKAALNAKLIAAGKPPAK